MKTMEKELESVLLFGDDNHVESQNKRILKHLESGRGVTSLEALGMFGTLRLAARIADLRAKGYPIRADMVHVGNKKKKVARYVLDLVEKV